MFTTRMSLPSMLGILLAVSHPPLLRSQARQSRDAAARPVVGANPAEPQRPYAFDSPSLGVRIGYYAALPTDDAERPDQALPVLLFLHGIGERGNGGSDLPKLWKWGPPALLHRGWRLPMLVISPQLPVSQNRWPVALIDELLASVSGTWHVDSSRIYLTGLSTGADAAWEYAVARPGVVAAIVPIAGAGTTDGICAMRDVAVWAFHGERDQDEKLEHESLLVAALNACQPPPAEPARLTVYSGAGHEVWSRTYDGTAGHDIYGWLLRHHR